MRVHRPGDDGRDGVERQSSAQELADRDFVRGIQNDRQAARVLERAVGEAQAGKRLGVRPIELETADTRQVERRQRRRPAIRVREGVLNRQPHVGHPDLRDHRSIDEFDHRVHDRLRVHDDVDLVGPQAEQPVGLDDLEAFVHQRRRINRDLAAHAPGRMFQRVGGRHIRQFRESATTKRSARRRQHDSLHLGRATAMKTLVDRVVLAVDRQDRHAPLPRRRGDDAAGHHQDFLVRQRDALPMLDRRQHRLESVGPGRGAQHQIDVRMRGHGDEAIASRAGDGRAGSRVFQAVDGVARSHRDDGGPVARGLLGETLGVLPCGQADHPEPIRVRINDRQRTLTNRAGGSENGDALHPLRSARPRFIGTSAPSSKSARRRAERRFDPGCHHGRESASSCPSRRRSA